MSNGTSGGNVIRFPGVMPDGPDGTEKTRMTGRPETRGTERGRQGGRQTGRGTERQPARGGAQQAGNAPQSRPHVQNTAARMMWMTDARIMAEMRFADAAMNGVLSRCPLEDGFPVLQMTDSTVKAVARFGNVRYYRYAAADGRRIYADICCGRTGVCCAVYRVEGDAYRMMDQRTGAWFPETPLPERTAEEKECLTAAAAGNALAGREPVTVFDLAGKEEILTGCAKLSKVRALLGGDWRFAGAYGNGRDPFGLYAADGRRCMEKESGRFRALSCIGRCGKEEKTFLSARRAAKWCRGKSGDRMANFFRSCRA